MKIHVYETQEVVPRNRTPNVAVVIDVLRATSVIVTALAHGVKTVWTVQKIEDAFTLKNQLGDRTILAGERKSLPLPGFDYGNSPLSFSNKQNAIENLVVCTSNGTRAIERLRSSEQLLLGSFLNVRATGEAIARMSAEQGMQFDEVWFVCAGTQGTFSLDDFLCAGAIVCAWERATRDLSGSGMGAEQFDGLSYTLNDQAQAAMRLWESSQRELAQVIAACGHGKRLIQLGFADDIEFCSSTNRYPIVVMRQMEKGEQRWINFKATNLVSF